MKSNKKTIVKSYTYEGGPAASHPVDQLERLVASCMLFEQAFYESGDDQAAAIAAECAKSRPEAIAALAIKAREEFKLRHVPLFLLVQLNKRRHEIAIKSPGLIRKTVASVVRRPDEASELLKLLAKEEKTTVKKAMSHAIEKGLAAAMGKFNEYQLSKWNRDSAEIKLRDVLFLTHAKPATEGHASKLARKYKNGTGVVLRHKKGQAGTFKGLVENTLPPADTWENAISNGEDKKSAFTRLIKAGTLGYIALLSNLRNMVEAGVDRKIVEKAIMDGAEKSKALPFRFFSAELHAPAFSGVLSDAMLKAVSHIKGSLPGDTAILVDVSGSMNDRLSSRGDRTRIDAAAPMAALAKEVCESSQVYTFSNDLREVKNTRGLPLAHEIRQRIGGGTYLGQSLRGLLAKAKPDRIIVLTDEQSADTLPALPKNCKAWIVNVAAYSPALNTSGQWNRVNGFSDRIFDYIRYEEGLFNSSDLESLETE